MLVRELMEFVRSGRGKVFENGVLSKTWPKSQSSSNAGSVKGSSRWRGRECYG